MARICFPCFLILFQIFLNFHLADSNETNQNQDCKDFTCGFLGTVGFPFCESSRPDCGLIKLDCAANSQAKLDLYGKKYEVIQKDNSFLRVVDHDLETLLKNSSCQTFYKNLSLPESPVISYDVYHYLTLFRCDLGSDKSGLAGLGSYNKCSGHEAGGFEVFYKQHPYDDLVNYGYIVDRATPAGCSRIELTIPLSTENRPNGDGPFGLLSSSFLLEWKVSGDCYECRDRGGRCIVDENNRYRCSTGKVNLRLLLTAVIAAACVVGIVIFAILLFYFRRKYLCGYIWNLIRPKTNDEQMLENFLANYGSVAPKRYSYSELRKMTESFKNQLGQGGFGCVYKGKMHNGSPVAVKVLKDLKEDGEGFINEVASISRTSHVNIVSLNGFCFDGRKRALVYEFMSNGSLEKFIYENKSSTSRQLEWKVLYNIAIGIARGLEYLHRGCNTRILHFDIKPHNILLDENFCPKISDFGLAKLCVNKESTVSIVGARGTIGYIAPEVVCRSIGGISYKSDVYSYGMMALEMVGGRKNVDVGVSRASEIYFPHWIHSRLELDEELELTRITNEEENEYARKMVIVSLWCIQMDPAIRPSMSKIVEMLEGNLSNLEIPPKPCFSSPSTSEVNPSSNFFSEMDKSTSKISS